VIIPHQHYFNMLQSTESTIRDLFKKYASSGFLPDGAPLTRLSDPYYNGWEELASQLPALIQTKTFRRLIDEMPVCSTDRLQTERDWRRAYVIMCYFSHGYVWGGDKPSDVCTAPIPTPTLPLRG
jgi:indoleamine 2,3-dioxygenase